MFWSRPMVSDDMRDWVADCFAWFDTAFPGPRPLILPTRDFFDVPSGRDEATARAILDAIRGHLGVHRDIALAPLDMLPAEHRHSYQALAGVAGTFQDDGQQAVIRYDPAQMERPLQFINTMAHEVMHAKLAPHVAEMPGGEATHELATDLGCIICGFGIFQLQSADDAGWSGYLSQDTRAHALGLFLSRQNLGEDAAAPHLSTRSRKLLRRALRDL